jgi:type I restriction-modification system DNA methylase subunit
MIFSDSWLSTDSFSEFRKFLVKNTKINHIVDLPNGVFVDAVVKTSMIFLNKCITYENSVSLTKLKD